jgi:hypothetical protein
MLRQGANEPQTQMVRDMRDALNAGTKQPIEYATTPSVDIKNSLEPFVMVFDSEGETIASSGQLNDGALRVPEGVLDYVANKSSDGVTGGAEHTVTLQPEPGVRLAAVSDFISVPFWSVFNVADIAIVIGVLGVAACMHFDKPRKTASL